MITFCPLVLLLAIVHVRGVTAFIAAPPRITQAPLALLNSTSNSALRLARRDNALTGVSTCGYKDGVANNPRTANSGYDCRVDTKNALWGFCPTTVIVASDCGLAGNCIDAHDCSLGCGISGVASITTFTCTNSGSDYCSTALLEAGPDQTYAYIACAAGHVIDTLLAAPTTTSNPSSSSRVATTASSSPSLPVATVTSSSTSSLTSLRSGGGDSSTSPTSSASNLNTIGPNASSSSSGSTNVGAIVGGVIGGAALICFVAVALLFLRRYRREGESPTKNSGLSGRNVLEKDGNETSLYPFWKKQTPTELPAHTANSPVELPSQ